MIIFKQHHVLDVLRPYLTDSPLIIEAGAFVGHDSIKMAKKWLNGVVHAFEPVPIIFDELIVRTAQYPTIVPHKYALSAFNGRAPLHVAHKPTRDFPTQASSLHVPHKRSEWS